MPRVAAESASLEVAKEGNICLQSFQRDVGSKHREGKQRSVGSLTVLCEARHKHYQTT